MKKIPLLAIIISILILVGFVIFYTSSNKTSSSQPLNQSSSNNTSASSSATLTDTYQYFWGSTCPHCANVAAFMETWTGRDKIKIDKREVYENQDNAKLLLEKAAICQIPKDQVPVPFLVTPEGKCIIGDQPIIDHFKSLKI